MRRWIVSAGLFIRDVGRESFRAWQPLTITTGLLKLVLVPIATWLAMRSDSPAIGNTAWTIRTALLWPGDDYDDAAVAAVILLLLVFLAFGVYKATQMRLARARKKPTKSGAQPKKGRTRM